MKLTGPGCHFVVGATTAGQREQNLTYYMNQTARLHKSNAKHDRLLRGDSCGTHGDVQKEEGSLRSGLRTASWLCEGEECHAGEIKRDDPSDLIRRPRLR
jgi:hypothetical protein